MSLGCGRFGPPLKVERTEKRWPPNLNAEYFMNKVFSEDIVLVTWLESLISTKFYGAEFIDID